MGGTGTASLSSRPGHEGLVRPLLLFIRTFQHQGQPHPVLSRSTSGTGRPRQAGRDGRGTLLPALRRVPGNRVRNATASGSVGRMDGGTGDRCQSCVPGVAGVIAAIDHGGAATPPNLPMGVISAGTESCRGKCLPGAGRFCRPTPFHPRRCACGNEIRAKRPLCPTHCLALARAGIVAAKNEGVMWQRTAGSERGRGEVRPRDFEAVVLARSDEQCTELQTKSPRCKRRTRCHARSVSQQIEWVN